MTRIRIDLQQYHLDNDTDADPELCAIALAIYEATDNEEIRVYGDMAYLGEPEHDNIDVYYLPYYTFDEPVSFDMILKENRYSDYQLLNGVWERKDDPRDYRIQESDINSSVDSTTSL